MATNRKTPPPPPPKRATSRVAPPPPPKRKAPPPPPSKRQEPTIRHGSKLAGLPPEIIAGAHVRRVTLNLIRHAFCCPANLRVILDKLANWFEWDLESLSRKEIETIFALVDKDLADRAKDEFEADTSTIVDLVRSHAPEEEQHCKLCGHEHIRWEFDLRNKAGGLTCKTGSVCIEEYGLNVDGEATAEAALAKLRAAISQAKRKAEREDWREEHPDHEADFTFVRAFEPVLRRGLHYGDWRGLKPFWRQRAKDVNRPLRAALKFYDRNGFLTELRTSKFYGEWGDLKKAREMDQELYDAREGVKLASEYWPKIMNLAEFYSLLDPIERNAVSHANNYAINPYTLNGLDEAWQDRIKSVREKLAPAIAGFEIKKAGAA